MKEKETKTTALQLKYAVIAILLCVAVGLGGFLLGMHADSGRIQNFSTVVLQNELTAMQELGTMTYAYTELGKYETKNEFYGVTLPFTTSSFILTYEGEIKAGVDMAQAKVAREGQTIRVSLPAAQILSHEIDEKSVQLYDEKTSIFNPFTVKDYTAFYADQKAKVEEKALARGLLAEAEKQAAVVVKGFLTETAAVGYEIEVKTQGEA